MGDGEFQFTHPGRGATALSSYFGYELDVSIHAPREGCDREVVVVISQSYVSIHAPREGCDVR